MLLRPENRRLVEGLLASSRNSCRSGMRCGSSKPETSRRRACSAFAPNTSSSAFVEKREAEKNEDDLKRLRGERSPPEIVRRARSSEEQRTLFQATGDPRPVVLALLGLSLAGSNPDNEGFGHGPHGENLGHRWKREDGELNVPPGRPLLAAILSLTA